MHNINTYNIIQKQDIVRINFFIYISEKKYDSQMFLIISLLNLIIKSYIKFIKAY